MEYMDYFIQLYGSLPRAGPGSNESTLRAYGMMKHLPPGPRILDIGCGPGMQTLHLAGISNGTVVATDILPQMIQRVEKSAAEAGLSDRITALEKDMNDLGFEPGSFDVIWCEGAIYFMGFRQGLEAWKKFLAKGGYFAVSEAVWLTTDPSEKAREFWKGYDGIDTVEAKLKVIEELELEDAGSFVLPVSDWTRDYYDPLLDRADEYESLWKENETAQGVLEEARREVSLFNECHDEFGYCFFVMRA